MNLKSVQVIREFFPEVQFPRNRNTCIVTVVTACSLLLYSSRLIVISKKKVKFRCSVWDTVLSYLYYERTCCSRSDTPCASKSIEEDRITKAAPGTTEREASYNVAAVYKQPARHMCLTAQQCGFWLHFFLIERGG